MDFASDIAGRYTFAVQYIDQDLRYSKPALATFNLVLPWYRNPAFVVPGACGIFGLWCGPSSRGSSIPANAAKRRNCGNECWPRNRPPARRLNPRMNSLKTPGRRRGG